MGTEDIAPPDHIDKLIHSASAPDVASASAVAMHIAFALAALAVPDSGNFEEKGAMAVVLAAFVVAEIARERR